jgi:hypothetical protein
MESRDVFTQEQLEDALAHRNVMPICAGDGEFRVAGSDVVRAADSARLYASDRACVHAGGSNTVVARGHAHVRVGGTVAVDADESVEVVAGKYASVRARGNCRVVARGQTTVEAVGQSTVVISGRALVRAAEQCHVRADRNSRVNVRGEARAWVWGNAVTHASERAAVTAWGSASVFAGGSVNVEALEDAVVIAGGAATVRAFGSAMVRARGRAQVEVGGGAAVMQQAPRVVVSGATTMEGLRPRTAEEWCSYYGVPVNDGVAVLYKAVDQGFESYHGVSYGAGSTPRATDWDGGERECGGGLHFSPRPTFALSVPADDMRFVACPVRLEDIVLHPDGVYPNKVKAEGVCAPVYEVSEDGSPVKPSLQTDGCRSAASS